MTAKGEGTIQAGDREVRLHFNNRSLAQAEEAMNKSVIAVASGFADGDTRLSDVAHLLRAGMDGARRELRLGGRAVTMMDAYDVLDEVGFGEVTTVVMTAVAAVLGYSANGTGDEDGDGLDPNE